MAEATVLETGSKERVALDLYRYVRTMLPTPSSGMETVGKELALFGECLNAVRGVAVDLSKVK